MIHTSWKVNEQCVRVISIRPLSYELTKTATSGRYILLVNYRQKKHILINDAFYRTLVSPLISDTPVTLTYTFQPRRWHHCTYRVHYESYCLPVKLVTVQKEMIVLFGLFDHLRKIDQSVSTCWIYCNTLWVLRYIVLIGEWMRKQGGENIHSCTLFFFFFLVISSQ